MSQALTFVVHYDKEIKSIFIESLEVSSELEERFLDETLQGHYCYEITFAGLKSLTYLMVLRLYHLQKRLVIYTMERSLWLYLQRLGIKNRYNTTLMHQGEDFSYEAFVLSGSTGSLPSIIALLQALPYAHWVGFIIIHESADQPSLLVEVLSRYTSYNICYASNNQSIQKGTLYVAPSGTHMVVSGGTIFLTHGMKKNHAKPSIDVLLESLAHEYHEELLSVTFSGYGNDGIESLQILKEEGSTVLIHDPCECDAKALPERCIQTQWYDSILSLEEIKRYFLRILQRDTTIPHDELTPFLHNIYLSYGHNFQHYEKKSLIRRIKLAMNRLNEHDFYRFHQAILSNKALFNDLFCDFSINVSAFFRNSEVFLTLRRQILPYLATYPHSKIWCAGCASGEEPYSLAILLHELSLGERYRIYASDFNPYVLQEARNGLFPSAMLELCSEGYHQSGGEGNVTSYLEAYEHFFAIDELLKKNIHFVSHNLATDSIFNSFNLILCRNVVIYFDEVLKKRVFQLFLSSLEMNGFLVLGESESLPQEFEQYFEVVHSKQKIYRKIYEN